MSLLVRLLPTNVNWRYVLITTGILSPFTSVSPCPSCGTLLCVPLLLVDIKFSLWTLSRKKVSKSSLFGVTVELKHKDWRSWHSFLNKQTNLVGQTLRNNTVGVDRTCQEMYGLMKSWTEDFYFHFYKRMYRSHINNVRRVNYRRYYDNRLGVRDLCKNGNNFVTYNFDMLKG